MNANGENQSKRKKPDQDVISSNNSSTEVENQTNQSKKKKTYQTLEGQFMYKLATCSKKNDLSGALSLYENAVSQNLRLNHNHFDTLLYLCSNSCKTLDSPTSFAFEKGFCIFNHMLESSINPSEATITSVARLASAKGDGDYAFELVKTMGKYNILPRLRTYGPALFAYCQKSEADKAYFVEEHMISMGIQPEESELALLMKVSVETGRGDKVYLYLQKLRGCTSCVNSSTAEIIEGWFLTRVASEVGSVSWDGNQVKDAISRNGGGWHGLGWFGKGDWVVSKSRIGLEGHCCSCGEQLACVDIDRVETEKFAESVASLAMERGAKSEFKAFQEWLGNHATYKAIVDGANIGLYQQNFANGSFSISQLDAVIKELYERDGKIWPLIILHNKRVRSLMNTPSNRKLVENWQKQGALYTTPNGSNDDWFWLYAAVKLKCLIVTNDEMRDHIFQLLGSNFFIKWKERHRVQFTFLNGSLRLMMPPLYSVVIQESEKGSWHVPVEGECSDEQLRSWLCVTRLRSKECSVEVPS